MSKVQIGEKVRVHKNIFTCSNGIEVKLKPVSRWLIDSRQADRLTILPPTYEVETAGGGKETHEHDETTLQTDEDKKAWQVYTDLKKTEERKFSEDMFRILVVYGTDVTLPEDDFWKKKQEFVGIKIPTDEVELYLHYIRTELFGIEEDATDLMSEVMALSGASEEDAENIRKSFRTAIQETRNKRAGIQEGKLEGKSKVRRTRNSKRVGNTPKPVL